MRFAISIPQYVRDGFDPGAFRAHLRRAEELGFESGWVQEQVLGAAGSLSPLETLTYAAACTVRLRLGCAVFVTPLHNPLHLVKAIGSLDRLSRGRVEVGIGAGGRARPFAAFGIGPDALVARFREGVALMKACWTESRIDFEGRFWQLEGAAMEPKPVQKPHPPIWIGGGHPVANGLQGDTFWLIAALGERAQYVRNIEAEPRVRVKARPARLRDGRRMRWRGGVARLVRGDDPYRRQRQLSRGRPGYRADAVLLRTLAAVANGRLLTVRIDLDPT